MISPIAIHQAAPEIPMEVVRRATDATLCQATIAKKLLIVDMSLPSSEPRLWAFDISNPAKPKLLTRTWVAHGAGSDPGNTGMATRFSNVPDSRMTSLGFYKVGSSYVGKHGESFELDGLSKGFNDNAKQRNVVFHPSDYITPSHQGRSYGCPAVSPETLTLLERKGLSDAYMWIDGPSGPTPSCVLSVAMDSLWFGPSKWEQAVSFAQTDIYTGVSHD